jgi:hypothetical protein
MERLLRSLFSKEISRRFLDKSPYVPLGELSSNAVSRDLEGMVRFCIADFSGVDIADR